MTTLGAVALPQLPPERVRQLARTAEEAGLDELWLWEDCFWTSGIATGAAVLGWTDRLRVGLGLLPVPLRNPALTAMELASLHRLFDGRARVGVGHGVQEWMRQVGGKAASPMTLLREHLTALRALLRGERLTTTGRYVSLDAVALDAPPASPPPLLVGATGPRTLRLAGELGDGTILTASTTPEQVTAARRLVDEGRAAAGRTEPHPLIVYVLAATGPGAAARLANRSDYQAEAGAGVAGDAAMVADTVARYVEAGADTVVLEPTIDDPDPEGFVRFAATEVAPLLR